ncbi:MAG TPA: hypothetical protein VFD92_13300 [Candidatus Binatia bacterium]|nr:hypothetical protein [Candidatus Binatia bacterium]
MLRRRLPLFVSAAALLVCASRANAQVGLPLDEYLCYQAKESKVPTQNKLKDLAPQVRVKDQFDATYRDYLVSKFVNVCNPVQTGKACPGPSLNPTVHLAEYAVKDLKAVPKFVAPSSVYNLADCVGARNGVTISKPKSLMVRSNKIDYGPIVKCKVSGDCSGGDSCQSGLCLPPSTTPPSANAMATNTADYTCYSVKGPKGPFGTVGPVTDQFGYSETYLMNKITKVCAPTEKVNLPSASIPDGNPFPGHLICYQAKSQKTNLTKFVAHEVAINNMIAPSYLDAKKVTDYCLPALKAIHPAFPTFTTPTTLTATTSDIGGVCGTITTNLGGAEGVPNRLDPASGTNANASCTGSGAPLPCCEGAGTGHCDERTSVICGGVAIGGGGPNTTLPGPELAQTAGQKRRFTLSCSSPIDTACTVSGNAGDLPNGVNCTTTGCGFLPPLDTTTPFKVCGLIKLAGSITGSLNLVQGTNSLTIPGAVNIYAATSTSFPDTACPRCRTTTATTSPEVFPTGPIPGIGVCDSDTTPDDDGNATNDGEAGDVCFVFGTAGLSTDCTPVPGLPLPPIPLTLNASTAGGSISDPVGHFCPGQGGNSDCVASGNPNPCCTGAGMGSCTNFNGCFGSANATGPRYADTPGVCTGVAVSGISSGILITGQPPVDGTIGGLSCLPAVSAGGLSPLINGSLGLPSPVAFTVNNGVQVN